jgi:hypothetical protein
MAAILEMSEKTYKLTELGQRAPKRSELLAVAEACEVPMWFLEGGWDNWRAIAPGEGAAGPKELSRAAEALRRERQRPQGTKPSTGSREATG